MSFKINKAFKKGSFFESVLGHEEIAFGAFIFV